MKTKFIVGIALAVLLLVIGEYFFLPSWYRELAIKVSGWLIMLSVAAGVALSVLVIVYVINKLLSGQPINLFEFSSRAPTGSKIGSYIAAIVVYPFALFIGFVVGGSFGGGLGGYAGDVGVVLGIGLGVFIVTALIGVIAALIGFVLGGFVQKLAT